MGRAIIRTPRELTQLTKQIEQATQSYVIDQAVELLKSISKEYMMIGGSDWYVRSDEFENAWGLIAPNIVGYLENMITSNPSIYQHGSPSWGSFVGDDLADAILNGYEVFDTGVHIDPRPIWDDFLEQLEILEPKWVDEALRYAR